MSNVAEQFTPRPASNEHEENKCCTDSRAWEMEMLHQVWAAGLHDAANCFQDALEAKWELESQTRTNGDRIRAMTDEELAECAKNYMCPPQPVESCCSNCKRCWLSWLRSPVKEVSDN